MSADEVEKLERRAELDVNSQHFLYKRKYIPDGLPLPEERTSQRPSEVRRLARRTGKYFQVYASGVSSTDSHQEFGF
jgi:hypothetical protein